MQRKAKQLELHWHDPRKDPSQPDRLPPPKGRKKAYQYLGRIRRFADNRPIQPGSPKSFISGF